MPKISKENFAGKFGAGVGGKCGAGVGGKCEAGGVVQWAGGAVYLPVRRGRQG